MVSGFRGILGVNDVLLVEAVGLRGGKDSFLGGELSLFSFPLVASVGLLINGGRVLIQPMVKGHG